MVEAAFGPGSAGMAFNNSTDVSEAEASSFKFVAAVEPLEKTEQLLSLAGVEASPVVFDVENNLALRLIQATDFYPRPVSSPGIFEGI